MSLKIPKIGGNTLNYHVEQLFLEKKLFGSNIKLAEILQSAAQTHV